MRPRSGCRPKRAARGGYFGAASVKQRTTTASLDRCWIEDRSRTVRQAFDDERGVFIHLPGDPIPSHERVEVEAAQSRERSRTGWSRAARSMFFQARIPRHAALATIENPRFATKVSKLRASHKNKLLRGRHAHRKPPEI